MVPTFLILLGATGILGTDLPDQNFSLLPPVNFTIKATGLAQVLLRWEPNPDQEERTVTLGYHVKVHVPEEEDYETRKTESRRVAALHRGFSASVRTIPWDGPALPASRWASAELPAPPGSPGTSAENLTCATRAAGQGSPARPRVALHCSWRAGRAAPADTRYFLYYRYGSRTEACGQCRGDARQRSAACSCPRTAIAGRGRDWLAVLVNGSSAQAAIQPRDQLFALHEIDHVNAPGNVTAEIRGTCLSVQWEKPVSAFPTQCFDYEVKIHNTRKGYLWTERTTANDYNSTVHDVSEYGVEVRAAVSSRCREGGHWGLWSPPIYVGSEGRRPWTEWSPLTLVAAFCVALLVSLACRTCHVWTKLFPPVPGPKSNIKDLAAPMNYEKAGSGEAESEVVSYVEEPGPEVLGDFLL